MYYILYAGHKGQHALWWKPNRLGYTFDLDKAGLYSAKEADHISRIRGLDLPICHESARSKAMVVVDCEETPLEGLGRDTLADIKASNC